MIAASRLILEVWPFSQVSRKASHLLFLQDVGGSSGTRGGFIRAIGRLSDLAFLKSQLKNDCTPEAIICGGGLPSLQKIRNERLYVFAL